MEPVAGDGKPEPDPWRQSYKSNFVQKRQTFIQNIA